MEVGRLITRDPDPVSIAVGASRLAVEARPALLTRFEIGVDDAVPFGQRLSGTVRGDVAPHGFNSTDHFMSEYLGDTVLDPGTVPTPEMQIGTADIRHADPDEHVVRRNRGYRVFAELHRCLRLGKDCDFPGFHGESSVSFCQARIRSDRSEIRPA